MAIMLCMSTAHASKKKILRMIPELSEYKAGREVILTFNKEW